VNVFEECDMKEKKLKSVLSTCIEKGLRLARSLPKRYDRYLVDPASSHMLVSKIKPCMSKHKPINGEAANGSLQQP
jgi:hypothetical protein